MGSDIILIRATLPTRNFETESECAEVSLFYHTPNSLRMCAPSYPRRSLRASPPPHFPRWPARWFTVSGSHRFDDLRYAFGAVGSSGE
jgi:hypothetical protein